MNDAIIARLRRNEGLKTLPDGSEAVPVTLQYRGAMPEIPRQARKQWLGERFAQLYAGLQLDLDSVSPSAQTVQALCPVQRFEEALERARMNADRLDIVESRQAQLDE